MEAFNIDISVTEGDALTETPQYLVDNGLIYGIDLCLIDSEHSYEFARDYCKKILPLLGRDCILIFHDIGYRPIKPIDIHQPFKHHSQD